MKKHQISIRKIPILLIIALACTHFQKLSAQSTINGSSVTIVGSSYTDTGAGNMTLKLPSNTRNGDVSFLFMGQSDSGSLKFPSGWKEITNWGRPGNYNDINLKIAYFVYRGGSKTIAIGTHKKSLVYTITLRGVDQDNPIVEDWTKNDTNNKYLKGDRGGCGSGSDGRAVAKSELTSRSNGLHFVAAMYDDPQRDVKIYTNDRYNREIMNVLYSRYYKDDGLTVGVEATNGEKTDNRYFKGNTCRGGNAEGVVASFTLRPSGSSQSPDYDNDGIPDSADTDDDNDGQSDVHENTCGSNPRNASSTSQDTDNDNIPNCIDTDDDNDGQSDVNEIACGSNPTSANSTSPDEDGDSIPNCKDPDYQEDPIGNSEIEIIGTSYTDTGAGNMILRLPNNTQNGDVSFLFMGQSDSGTLKFPSGWKEITNWGRPGNYNDINLKIAYFVYRGGSKTITIGTHKKSLVYTITMRGVDQDNPVIDDWTINDTNNKYLKGDRGGCSSGSDGRALAKSELTSEENGLHFVAAMYDDPQRNVKVYTNDSYNRQIMDVLYSRYYQDDGLTVAMEKTNGDETDYRYFKGPTCRGGNAEGVVASFTIRPSSGDNNTPDNDETWLIDNCDTKEGWRSENSNFVVSGTKKEGTNSIKSIGSSTAEFYKSFQEKDMTGATTLEFWYYISTKNGLLDNNQVELGSGGRSDRNEYHWSINKNDLQVGWNAIKLNINDARTTGGQPDISKINWFRLYRKKTSSSTTRIDHIRMTGSSPKVIDFCDSTNGWSSSNPMVISGTNKEGTNSIKSTGKNTDEFYRSFSEKDMTGTTTLEFWYYISSKNGLLGSNQVELGSGGGNDRNEYNWSININDLQVGWNAVKLNISDARITGGQPDLSKLNWFRLYRKKNSSVTTRIDFIRMTNNQSNAVNQGNKEYTSAPKHALYPNPSKGEINLSIIIEKANTQSSIIIKNIIGQTIYKKEINGLPTGSQQISISDLKLSPAMYVVEIKTYKAKKTIKFLVVD